ncbi:alpha/beta fold hydrolase [Microbacterium sp. zg.B185]|uniref:alpha/beta fold hydrolase n=1 Tax=Microbacterium sp. zg.B185 TaxID=2969410 RepID=UPI0027D4644B
MVSERAALAPPRLPGLDARFSRIVAVPGAGADAGLVREWHCLDTGAQLAQLGAPIAGTIVAVHGNPTWSYLWRHLLTASVRAAAEGASAWRVVAVDQLDMGFSERTGVDRTLAQRVADLGAFTDALALDGPVVTLGHDWGGVVSLGWAVDHPESLAGIMLLNTAVHQPDGAPVPGLLRLAGARGVLAASTVATTAFLDTTLALASPALDAATKDAYRAPYRSAARRRAIGGFVAEIPASGSHRSHAELERIASGVARLDVPALMLWGPNDPIFGDRYLDDLVDRLPHADVHRFEGASHLVAEDRPYADALLAWLGRNSDRLTGDDHTSARQPPAATSPTDTADPPFVPIWHGLDRRHADEDIAIVDMSSRGARPMRRVSWRQLDDRVRRLAAGLHAAGVRRGDRVSLLVQPGPTLSAVVYACLRIGAVVVVADAGLGIRGLTRAVRGSWPDVIIGEVPGLTAARALGWPGTRISAAPLPAVAAKALGVSYSLQDILRLGDGGSLPIPPGPADEAAILFTSGSTGPAKGVAYTHAQLSALRDVLASHFEVSSETGLVTGFAPFALLGPALGARSVTPDMDVSSPRTLTAKAVADAVRESDARIVFLSPAAILNVVDTAAALTAEDRVALGRVRTFLSTGAPISAQLLEAAAQLMPNATPHTPYGMTECLLVTDITLAGVHAAADAPDAGVCVGSPIGSNRVLISALDPDGRASGAPTAEPGVLGEIVVSASHLKAHYDRLWITDQAAARHTERLESSDPAVRWHRTGDVGHLDASGRLWIEGRLPHLIVTADGPLAPVGPEQQVERVDGVRRAAVVGVGPEGLRQTVAVLETVPAAARAGLASADLSRAVRASSAVPLVAVLVVPRLPTDIRHNSKIDRSRLSAWAERTLAGTRPVAP